MKDSRKLLLVQVPGLKAAGLTAGGVLKYSA